MKKQFCQNGHDTFVTGRDSASHCKLCKKQHEHLYHLENKIVRNTYSREYYKINKSIIIDYVILKRKTDINYRLRSNLRRRISTAVRDNLKSGSAVNDLGCSIPDFKKYIESKFYSNMSWANWGEIWELDHIKRLADFDLTDREQFLKACHYTNLQPLAVEDHAKKSGIEKAYSSSSLN
jgi:hypothetical protein